jgi:crotonobetainyl-CoA:carnitine CoA-transferase CaiB-like acyl-CoA transferase
MAGALDGLRVLDFTHVLAGPFATRVMGDMGADVVKVLSASRATGAGAAHYPYYIMWNRNKRNLSVDMANEEARAACRRLCEKADVVIENFSVGVLDRWGVGFEEVRKANPGVIYVSMSGMGNDGPWSKFVTYAPTIHALAGLTYLTGVPGREDIGIGFSYNDHHAGLHAVVAVLAAIEARRRTGRGQYIDLSQFELGVTFAGPALLDYFANGHAAQPMANTLPYDVAAPHDCYPTLGDDRWIAIAVMTDAQWRSLRKVMGEPAWAMDGQYDTAAGRAGDAVTLDQRMSEWTRTQDGYALQEQLQAAGVPAGVVQDGADLVERDPQLRHYGFLRQTDDEHPDFGAMHIDALPIHMTKTPAGPYRASRKLGADNAEVLREWADIREDDVRALEERGVLK